MGRYAPWQLARLAVPPGMTGWWQVNGRSNHPMHLSTDDDLYYLAHYSLALDLCILVRTVLVVLRGTGAYYCHSERSEESRLVGQRRDSERSEE
jgi:lipopolysaccharide/colanic/teichoic acid biosynthesis glycosyltransferase